MLFACVYRSPTSTLTSQCNNEKLNDLLRMISTKKYSHKCIVGDLNFKHINWETCNTTKGEDSVEYKFLDAVRDSFLHQHIEKPTRKRGKDDPSLLDIILTDESMQVSNISHLAPLGKSDHNVITFDFNCYMDSITPKEYFCYNKGTMP